MLIWKSREKQTPAFGSRNKRRFGRIRSRSGSPSRIALFERLEQRRLLAALRLATYNVLQGGPNTSAEQGYYSTIIDAIGNETKAGVTRPVDLLVLQETDSNSVSSIESIFDSLYTDDYATIVSPSYSGLAFGFVYNTATIQLLGSTNLTGGTFTRPPLRGHFNPVGASTSESDFFVYSTHLKAGSSSGDASTRAAEASLIRSDADALGEGENVLILGDFNMKNSFEGAYQNLTASGAGQVFDPINSPGSWFNNNAFKSIHTQDPSGGGGMDDRFDLQFVSGELNTPGGLDYLAGSYHAFGNNGTHSLNGTLTGTGASSTVLTALRGASDHLPVVADYSFETVTAGVTVTETGFNTAVTEGSLTDSYSVVLDSVPNSNVTITVDPDSQIDLGSGAGFPVDLIFTPANALTSQTVQVSAFDDAVVEGPHSGLLVHSISSSDTNYSGLFIDDINVAITDNETLPPASVVISEIMYNPATTEGTFSPEWVEIVNTGTVAQDISGWQLDDEDVDDWGVLPPSTTLQSGQAAVLFDGLTTAFTTEAGFRSAWNVPAEALVIGVDWPDLDNDPSATNEILQLRDGTGALQDSVNFDDEGSWPLDTPEGPSIYLTDLFADNNAGENWARSVVGTDDAVAASGFPYSTSDVGSPGNFPAIITGPFIEVTGSVQEFAGSGSYAIDFMVTANNGPATIGGFNLPMSFDTAGFSFSGLEADYSPATEFNINLVTALSSPFTADYGFQSAAGLQGLSLSDGETARLFTVNVVAGPGASVPSLTEVAQIVTDGIDESLISFSDEIFTSMTVTIGNASSVTPAIAPAVSDVIVAGVGGTFAWTPEFIDAVDDGSTGPNNGLGYSVIGTTRTVPWFNVNTIYVQFSEDVNVSGADLFGVDVADYAGNFTVSTTGSLATITMTTPFGLAETDLGPATTGIDKLLLRLQTAAVTDLAGNFLASEFTQQIDVLPGDGTGNGSVNNQDVGLTNLRGFLTTTDPGPNGFGFFYDPFYDITANGGINNQDVGLTNFQGFDELPSGTPTPPMALAGSPSPNTFAQRYDWDKSVDDVFALADIDNDLVTQKL